ncbi:MAG: NO-inducible flavohemoprotein [Litoreibacter sp.]|uniref:NO-inducible flavohemoprotein n=1 Tax=Litoreibacter sp. TaxID=1969459 RepID=UPI00329A1AA7
MLSQKTIDIVKSTVPVLSENGTALTSHFYKRMFERNPEVKPYFNASNQAEGRQQQALAGAIVAFAKNVDNLEALTSAVELIANKHASLMIKPTHYPIVGENLLASIQEFLNLEPSSEIITAWGEAYDFLAGILIGREATIYKSNAEREGGWSGFRSFRVTKRVQESSLVTSFYLEPQDGGSLPEYLPGQYLTVRVPTPDGHTTMRNYSLSDLSTKKLFRISVKHEQGRVGAQPVGYVSNYLHTLVKEGGTLEVGPPCGEFVLKAGKDSEKPLVFLAGGIGVTPLLSMISSALDEDAERSAIFVHACLNEEVQPFRSSLEELANRYPNLKLHHRYEQRGENDHQAANASDGRVDETFLDGLLEDTNADYYICGPSGFMSAMSGILSDWNIPASQVRLEAFGPQSP